MRKFLVLYNVVFLFLGNVLISEIHHLISHNHHDNHGNHGNHEHSELDCQECVIIDGNNNCILDSNQTELSENNQELLIEVYSCTLKFDTADLYSPRAPPIS